jgi:hypothetical protein
MNTYNMPNQPSPTETTTLYKTTRVLWYIFYVLEVLLAFRFFLKMFGANAGAGFTDFIYTLSSIPLAPFRFVFSNNAVGSSVFEWSTLLAMAVYWVLVWGIVKLVLIPRTVDINRAKDAIEKQDNV